MIREEGPGHSDSSQGIAGRLRVAVLLRSLDIGGAQRQVVTLAKALRAGGDHVVVVVFYPGGSFVRELQENGITVRDLGKRGRWDVVGFGRRLLMQLRAENVQVVYTFLVEPSILGVLLKPFLRGTRVVWGVRASRVEFSSAQWFSRLSSWLATYLSRFADLVIANSGAGADYHRRRGYPASKLVVVHNGIDVERFRPDGRARTLTRALWGIPESEQLVGVVARIDRLKDHGTVLQAFAILRRTQPNVRCVFIGTGDPEYEAELRAAAAELDVTDRLMWLGAQDDIASLYSALDVVCSASLTEGFPNVLAEAMACGVPCVATDVGETAAILGTFGVIVRPSDPARLADGLHQALTRRTPDSDRARREHIMRRFGTLHMVERTRALLHKCIDAGT